MVGRESQKNDPIALGRRICGAEALLRLHLEIRPEKQHFIGICINMLTFLPKEKLSTAFTQRCNQEILYFSHKDAPHYLARPMTDPSHRAFLAPMACVFLLSQSK